MASRIVRRRANPLRGQFGSEARLVLQTEELDLLALLVYLLSLEVDKARAETERAVEVRVAIVLVIQLAESSACSTADCGAGFAASTTSQGRVTPIFGTINDTGLEGPCREPSRAPA